MLFRSIFDNYKEKNQEFSKNNYKYLKNRIECGYKSEARLITNKINCNNTNKTNKIRKSQLAKQYLNKSVPELEILNNNSDTDKVTDYIYYSDDQSRIDKIKPYLNPSDRYKKIAEYKDYIITLKKRENEFKQKEYGKDLKLKYDSERSNIKLIDDYNNIRGEEKKKIQDYRLRKNKPKYPENYQKIKSGISEYNEDEYYYKFEKLAEKMFKSLNVS